MIVVGVDPGALYTGIAVVAFERGGRRLVSSATVKRDALHALPIDYAYMSHVLNTVRLMSTLAPNVEPAAVGVETIREPNRHMGRAAYNVEPLLATAFIAGAVMASVPWPIQVPPGGNGGGPLGSYPEGLVSAQERRRPGWQTRVGGDHAKLRHERSAYDVAIRAAQTWKGTQ